jgi:hypothetical protein
LRWAGIGGAGVSVSVKKADASSWDGIMSTTSKGGLIRLGSAEMSQDDRAATASYCFDARPGNDEVTMQRKRDDTR